MVRDMDDRCVSVVLYVFVFAPVRAVAGDLAGALSAVPVLVAGSLFGRRRTWVVAMVMMGGDLTYRYLGGESRFQVTLPRAGRWSQRPIGPRTV